MKLNEVKQVIEKHLSNLINDWFSDKPLIKGIAHTVLKANINKYDNLIELITDEKGDVLIDELVNNLNLNNGYEIDLTTISPFLPARVIIISKEDIEAIIREIKG